MIRKLQSWAVAIVAGMLAASTASAQQSAIPGRQGSIPAPLPLDELVQQFNAGAPPTTDGVELDAWVERTDEGTQVVVQIEPQGALKLVADPGITVTPTARPGVTWLVPVPLRHVDPQIDYFAPPALVRLPFAVSDDRPVELLVEYAYCVVDFQCFFGEETLSVATRLP
jgi:hypothetical protein